jgi:hypothetical protein
VSPARPTLQRLLIATAVAMVALLAASWLTGRLLPATWQQLVQTRWGYLAPVSYVVTALCMAVGGALAGHRFLIVAVGLTLAMWIATLSAPPSSPAPRQASVPPPSVVSPPRAGV